MSSIGSPVPAYLQVLIALRFFATGGQQLTISDCYDVSQPYVSLCVKRVAAVIGGMCRQIVKMPSGNDVTRVMGQFQAIAGMPAIIGAIDCTHIKICRPPGDRPELYRNRKGYFSLNVQAVCGPDLQFFNVVSRWWGSAHDSNIFDNSRLCQEFEDGLHRGHLLGDAGYPCRKYLLTPLINPREPNDIRYNERHTKTRNTIERAFGLLKRRFSCLGKCLYTALENSKNIIVAALVLHNIAVVQNVPMPSDVDVDVLDEPNPEGEEPVLDGDAPQNLAGNAERRRYIRLLH